ncbi:ABC transporter substrate-binding protein [Ottowia testudinis]|uniref:ABC transporter substrate-binding protein n=1 Tax=Ottowia testudinis TaxID=2816950 RepID=A0A975CK58_9BURK|nr:ABC transporter substrate-binding protein [Ottowia testudinis]QTD44938.1 ABC transporter substrate-binding protein [Ottowia testudinis]
MHPQAQRAFTPTISRRQLVLTMAALPLAARAQGGALRIGQSTAMTGALGDLGSAMHHGARAAFAAINAAGGVNGRTIDLVVEDDGYDAKRAVANVDKFLADGSIFALFNCMGTPAIAAMLPKVKASGVPFFAPFTGAMVARDKDARNVLNIRASYPEEAAKLVYHLATIGIARIGVAYQDNAFGKEVYDGAKAAIEKYKLTETTALAVEGSPASIDAAVDKLLQADIKALVVGLAGKPLTDFVKAVRAKRRGLPLYALSVLSSAATIKTLGDDATGITVSQVMPLPSGASVLPIVREFMRDWQAAKVELEPSHLALEGYIDARVFAEVLRRSGASPTRASFIDAAYNLKQLNLGGFDVGFTSPGDNASRFVELTMIGRGGKFVK